MNFIDIKNGNPVLDTVSDTITITISDAKRLINSAFDGIEIEHTDLDGRIWKAQETGEDHIQRVFSGDYKKALEYIINNI